jgi:hypothetical protein
MTPRDDRFPDMFSSARFDAAIEQVLRGDAVGDDAASIAAFVDDMRAMADRPPAPPSPELATLLRGRAATREASATVDPSRPRTRSRRHARSTPPTSRRSRPSHGRLGVIAVPIAAKAAAILAVATTAAAGAAAGILPDPATHFVRRAIEVVTPFELPDDDAARPGQPDHRVDDPGATAIGPGDAAPPAGTRSPAHAPAPRGAQVPDAGATNTPIVPNPTGKASSWAGVSPEPATSTGSGAPDGPASPPPPSEGPTKAALPPAGPPTEPGPKTGHVPGQASPGIPRPGGPGSGVAPVADPDPATDRPDGSAATGRPAQPEPAGEPRSNAGGDRPHDVPPPARS